MNWFLSPPLILSIAVGSLYGGFFHLIWGEKAIDLFTYWLASLVGFSLGQVLGNILALDIIMIGQVHLLEASIFSWVALIVARWLKK